MSQSYTFRFWRAVDRLLNVVTAGDDEETISHRVARARERGVWWGRMTCWGLDWVVPNHCTNVLARPNPSDATVPLDAPLDGDANRG